MQKRQLFLIHFAGGNCYSYQPLKEFLNNFEVISLELPGRGRRMDEPLIRKYALAADDIYRQIVNKLKRPDYAIFGHSMGARIALTVTKMMEEDGNGPAHLFVSGNPGPGAHDIKTRYKLPKAEFLEELTLLGGVPKILSENEEMFAFFEPILRADFELVEGDTIAEVTPLEAPIYAMMGDAEENSDKIENWANFTNSSFNYEVLDGDHFFIFKHPERVANIISNNLSVLRDVSQGAV